VGFRSGFLKWLVFTSTNLLNTHNFKTYRITTNKNSTSADFHKYQSTWLFHPLFHLLIITLSYTKSGDSNNYNDNKKKSDNKKKNTSPTSHLPAVTRSAMFRIETNIKLGMDEERHWTLRNRSMMFVVNFGWGRKLSNGSSQVYLRSFSCEICALYFELRSRMMRSSCLYGV